jgi:folate-binding protein YgfZ
VRARLSPEATAEAFASGVVARAATRDVVVVRGPDALSYLQGQCSQDLAPLAEGGTTDALVLSVQGKLVALVRIWRRGPEELVVETAAGVGEALYERLRRFKIRVKAQLEAATWPLVEVRGPGAAEVAPPGTPGAAVPTGVPWPAVDLLGEAVEPAGALPAGDEGTFEAARIEAGIPAMGAELDEGTIPHEAGVVPWTVSFTKGCYTGQELVARLDARGARVPKVLRGLVAGPAEGGDDGAGRSSLSAGWVLRSGERELGRVTSAAWSPFRGATVALAYVRREVDPPARLEVATDEGGPVPVEVRALPLWEAPGG